MAVELHPVLPRPKLRDVLAAVGGDGALARGKWEELHRLRAETIRRERADPFRFGWEPSVWRVADALLGLRVAPVGWRERSGLEWGEWAERTRAALGFGGPLSLLFISGANRSGKSEYAAKRTVELGLGNAGFQEWCFRDSEDVSIEHQQKLIFKYLPAELRARDVKSRQAYIAYKEQTGFAGRHVILPNGSSIGFRFYGQDLAGHEGVDRDWIWPDELIGPDLLETLTGRIATRGGKIVVTFTPVLGWTATVQLILQGATVTRESTAFFLPTDGGPPDVARGLGFSCEEEMAAAHEEGLWCRAVDVTGWHKGDSGEPAAPGGRSFARMPRVMRCARSGWGAMFFLPMDNPYGNPLGVWNTWKDAGREQVERRVYGFARKSFSAQFPAFDRRVHVVPADSIPREGTNLMFCDPTPGGRPFVFAWARACRGRLYWYREWPNRFDAVPGYGVLGAWAVPSGARGGRNDGKPGPGQDPLEWGLRHYLELIGGFEGWSEGDLARVRAGAPVRWEAEPAVAGPAEGVDVPRAVRRLPSAVAAAVADGACDALGVGSVEGVALRWIDCRAASAPRMENDRPRTLQTDFEEWGLDFYLTPGGAVVDKVARVNSMLAWDRGRPMSWENAPRMYFSDRCENMIYSMENWMNADGQAGACKDFVDPVLWAAELGCEREG